jgi:lysophospholipase L1-like esterase
MRAPFALVVLSLIGGCTRQAPPAPAPPVAKEDRTPPTAAPPPQETVAAPGATPSATPDPDKAPSLVLAAAVPEPPSLAGKTVLHVGDSMVGGSWGLTRALETKFKAEGAKFVRESKVSESIASFDKADKLHELVARYHPDIILVTLGTNDALVPYPQALASHLQHIAKSVGSRECYWIGPPLWKPDTGILAVLRENIAPCKFYDSSPLKLQRASDGIHPTDKGGADWADHFWTYFRNPTHGDAGLP